MINELFGFKVGERVVFNPMIKVGAIDAVSGRFVHIESKPTAKNGIIRKILKRPDIGYEFIIDSDQGEIILATLAETYINMVLSKES